MTQRPYQPTSIDEDGDPIDAPEDQPIRDEKTGQFVKGHKSLSSKIKLDSDRFRELYRLYNTIYSNGRRALSKSQFAKELGVSLKTLYRILDDLSRDKMLDDQFKDDAIIAIQARERKAAPDEILARMGIMPK